ncbi:MAG: hypothetical protein J5506_05790 [Prevotella sp.]|nr:hypothetical protein [Prevotella sp.]
MEKKTYIIPLLKALYYNPNNGLCLATADTETEEEGDFEPDAKEGLWMFQNHHSPWDEE